MVKNTVLLALVILTLAALLASCGGGTQTTSPTTSASPSTSPVPTVSPPTTTPQTTVPTTPATTTPATTSPTTTPANDIAADNAVVEKMVSFLYNLTLVQNYYDDGVSAMASFEVSMTESAGILDNDLTVIPVLFIKGIGLVPSSHGATSTKKKVPKEFMDKLPSGGTMPAPAGACPAAAEPEVQFETKAGDTVTPDMFTEKDIKTIPSELVTMAQNDPGSLYSYIETLIQPSDYYNLTTVSAWNTYLWDKLRAKQAPIESLMDYQLWNAENDIMNQIADMYYERLVAQGAPDIVLNAYTASRQNNNWYGNSEPTEGDALAQMQIEATLTGSLSGTVHEQRDFEIPGSSQTPVYGVQTGNGVVSWNLPDGTKVDFNSDINLDKFDENGLAIGGTVVADAIGYEGYRVVFTFNEDGSKDGVIYQDGVEQGYLTMTVDHEKFENYIDVASGTTLKLPDELQQPQPTVS